jgi:16S rRNA (guanine527-N7)-methyltransferase
MSSTRPAAPASSASLAGSAASAEGVTPAPAGASAPAEPPTVPAPPASAAQVFGPVMPLATRFAALLATDGVERGLLGPREVPRLWERHLMNCAVVAELLPAEAEVVDVGSGAGLPGLVFAMLRPSLRIILLEPMLRRTVFLEECIAALELPNVTVRRGRAEDLAGALQADVATSRAVAPLARLVPLSAGVIRPGGTILAIKGQDAEAELKQAGPVLRQLGVRSADVVKVGQGIVEPPATVVRILTGETGRNPTGAAGRRRPSRKR